VKKIGANSDNGVRADLTGSALCRRLPLAPSTERE
jgi:hypothetical protein